MTFPGHISYPVSLGHSWGDNNQINTEDVWWRPSTTARVFPHLLEKQWLAFPELSTGLHLHLSPIPEPRVSLGHHRWLHNQFALFFCSPLPSWTWRTPGLSIPWCWLPPPPLSLSAMAPSPFHCGLQDGFGQTWWTGGMSRPWWGYTCP